MSIFLRIVFAIVYTLGYLVVVLFAIGHAAAQSGTGEPARYQYRVTGVVLDEHGKAAAKVKVCWWPVERPLNGRIPCTETDESGHYDLKVSDVPDKYNIVASDTGPWLPLDNKETRKHSYRSASSGILWFGANDESRTVDLRLGLYKWSKKTGKFEQVL
jgi:hypothetical protein